MNIDNSKQIQIGTLEDDHRSIIELIDIYKYGAAFLEWISDSTYTRQLVYDKTSDSKYLRFCIYHIEGVQVHSARAEFNLDYITESSHNFLKGSQKNEPLDIPPDFGIERNPIRRIISEPYYTIIAQLMENDRVIGMIWEIYELPELAKFYAKKDDPLRYWMLNRTE
ncbi:MAG: hypothetical protein JSR58_03015 [Verrucomicrobia bacterium]|nr:hypothetical protein [Verrucomicrobiota bacterium]